MAAAHWLCLKKHSLCTRVMGDDPPAPPPGINDAFENVYRMLQVISIIIAATVLVMSVTDLISYTVQDAKQRVKLAADADLPIDSTTDMASLKYSRASIEDEPYNVFRAQQVIAVGLLIAGVYIATVGAHLGTFAALRVHSLFNNRPFTDRADIPRQSMVVLIVVAIMCIAARSVYHTQFVRGAQTAMRRTRAQLDGARTFVQNNLSDDATFLAALRANNMDDITDFIRNTLQSRPSGTCTDKRDACDGDVEKMLVSINLYSYLRFNIPPGNPNREKVMRMFVPPGDATGSSVHPSSFLYMQKVTHVANLYPTLRPRLIDAFGDDPKRERIFVANLNRRMQDINELFARLQNISSGKQKLRRYMVSMMVIGVVACAVLLGVHWDDVAPPLTAAVAWLASLLSRPASR